MKKNVIHYLIVITFLSFQLIANVAFAKANVFAVSPSNQSPILLSSHLGIFEDASGILTLADVQKKMLPNNFKQICPPINH